MAVFDYVLIMISSFKEGRRIKRGAQINSQLSGDALEKVNRLKKHIEDGNVNAMYILGKMYLDADEIGYDPELGRKYFEMASKHKDFDAYYALAMYYKGEWSYMHQDAFKCHAAYSCAKGCKTDDVRYLKEVERALNQDFEIYHDKDVIRIFFKNDVPIK